MDTRLTMKRLVVLPLSQDGMIGHHRVIWLYLQRLMNPAVWLHVKQRFSTVSATLFPAVLSAKLRPNQAS